MSLIKSIRLGFIFVCLLSVFSFLPQAFAEKPTTGIGQWIQEIGVFSGYASGSLDEKEDLQVIPLGLRIGFDLKPFTRKFGMDPKGMLELLYEPFLSPIISPKSNLEAGLAFFFRYSYPLTQKLYPYIEVGSGLYYMTLHTREQSTQFNFIDQGGAGLTYFVTNNWALNVGYRMRHVSNAGIDHPNSGINANVYTAGLSYYF